MGRIILARHGQDIDNADGILNGRRNAPLTALGISQARNLGLQLMKSELRIKRIFSSPLRRAVRTADICSLYLGVPRTVLGCLIERSHGILEGHHHSDIPHMAKSWRMFNGQTYVLEVEGGENYAMLCERARDALSQIRAKIAEFKIHGDVLVVSHGAIGRAIEVVHQGLTHERMFDFTSFSNCEFRILE